MSWPSGQPGIRRYFGSDLKHYPPVNTKVMTDVVGNPRGENPLSITSFEVLNYTPINGKFGSYNEAIGLPPSGLSPSQFSINDVGGYYQSATDAIAAAHPGAPHVALPVFLFELKDVPRMLKHAMNRARVLANAAGGDTPSAIKRYLGNPSNPAEDWLNYNFGWRPFVSDISSIYSVADWMHSRAKMMRGFSPIITRRSNLGSNISVTRNNNIVFDSTITSWFGTDKITTTTKKWCVSHWVKDPMRFNAALSTDHQYLRRHALGLNFAFSHLWDAMPWSWLVDWFTDAGSVIHALQNRMGIRFLNASVMTNTRAVREIWPKPPRRDNMTSGSAQIAKETKSRSPTTPSILPSSIPYLGTGQLATLAALAVTRGRGSSSF